jgi:probable phosphoglycerate mutase
MTQLLLIRHAHNDWVNQRLAGWTSGVHLSGRGHDEARALADRLADYPLDAVYSSPLDRALETARYLAEPRGLLLRVLEAVGEVEYGEWTGQDLQALRQDPLWKVVQTHPSLVRFPGGESLPEVQARAVAAVEALRAEHGQGVLAIVTHGDVIKALIAHYAGLHLDHFQRFAVATASVSVPASGPSSSRARPGAGWSRSSSRRSRRPPWPRPWRGCWTAWPRTTRSMPPAWSRRPATWRSCRRWTRPSG